MSSITRYWIPTNDSHKIQKVTMQQRQVSRQAFLNSTPNWQQYVQSSQQILERHLRVPTLEVNCTFERLHHEMLSTFCTFFPPGKVDRAVPTWQPALDTILNKWDHRRSFLRPRVVTMTNVFQLWYHVTKFCSLKRLHRKQAKIIRNTQFAEVVESAAAAATRHDTHKLFQIINRYAPKQPRKQIQLRNHAGHMASPTESAALVNKFVSDTWSGPKFLHLQFDQAPGVPFTEHQLEKALRLIPVTRAVAKPFTPGVIWHQLASDLATLLHSQLQVWWAQNPPLIPDSWRHGWLFLIPKPNKPPVTPLNLRPLALQEPVGKAVIGLLIHLAMQDVQTYLVHFPLWSYVEHRSTLEAIRRVGSHCATVRQMVQHSRSTPHSRAMMLPRKSLFGGLQICLDLQRAFDQVNRYKLFSRLHELNVRPAIIQLLSSWHEDTIYFTQAEDLDTPIEIGKGVRQGCKAAPGLWSLFTLLFMHDLMEHVTLEWIQQHLTIYADDFHIGVAFESLDEFQSFLQVLGILFSTLASLDMTINPSKSVAILEMRGAQCRAIRRQFVRRDSNGESLKIMIPDHETMYIPLHKSTKYLGVIISYTNFEDSSLRHRLTLMHVGFRRLQRWLTGKHCLSTQQRYKLWHTCVFPIFSYGIFATGITPHGIKKAVTQLTVMLRRIIHDHSFLTHRTNESALKRADIPSPVRLLHGAAFGLLRTLFNRHEQLQSHDLALQLDWTHLSHLLVQLDHMQDASTLEIFQLSTQEATLHTPLFQCAKCDFCTEDVSVFRRHCTTAHGQQMLRTNFVNPFDHAVEGLPQCKHCQKVFTTWRGFTAHLERGCQELLIGPSTCTVTSGLPSAALGIIGPAEPTMTQPSQAAARGLRLISEPELHNLRSQPFGDQLLHIVHERDWNKVASLSTACQYLSSRCVICAFQFTRCQELQQHYRLQHPDLWEFAPQKAIQLTDLYSTESPCSFCGAMFLTHSCPTWSQLAVLLVNGAGLEAADDLVTEERQRCDLCLQCFGDVAALVQHLQSEHGLQGLSFNESRDSLDNSTACAHCGQLFLTTGGLKSHIVQGRCHFFNPQASAETKPVEDLWKQACLDGRLLEVLRPAAHRMRLTVVCQACGKSCRRAADLANHLQTAHARLWRQARRLTMVLTEAYSQQQCFCNPSLGIKRGSHTCLPLRQLAMCFHRLKCEPFAPTVITDEILQALLSDKLPRADRYRLEQVLVHRHFDALWQDSEILQLLRSQCMFCGARPLPAELNLHLREEHPCQHAMVQFYMEQLQPHVHAHNPDDFQCHLCRLIFNLPAHMRPDEPLPDRVLLTLSHLRGSCPVLTQLALLLGSLLHGGPLGFGCEYGSARPDHSRSNAGDIQRSGAHVGQESEPGSKPTENQSSTQRRGKQPRRGRGHTFAGQRVPQGYDSAHHHGQTADSSRSRNEQPAPYRSIHSFFESSSNRCTSSPDTGIGTMEEKHGDQAEEPGSALETAPGPHLVESPPHQCRQDCGEPGQGQAVPDVGAEGLDPCRPELPFSSVGCSDPAADHRQEASHQLSKDVSTSDGTPGNDAGQGAGGQISCTTGSLPADHQSHSLEIADQPEKRQSLRLDPSALPQLGMDGGGGYPEDALTSSITHGNVTANNAGQAQRERQREAFCLHPSQTGEVTGDGLLFNQMVSRLCGLTLCNDRNWC
jgi:hypothetical protein